MEATYEILFWIIVVSQGIIGFFTGKLIYDNDKTHNSLFTKVNKLGEDVAFIKGKINGH